MVFALRQPFFALVCLLAVAMGIPHAAWAERGRGDAEYDQRYEAWVGGLREAYLANPETEVRPESLPYRPIVDRMQNELFAWLAIRRMKQAPPLPTANSNFLDVAKAKLNELKSKPYAPLLRGSAFRNLEKLVAVAGDREGAAITSKMSQYAEEYYTDVLTYQKKYGPEFFTEVAVARGAINVISMRIFAELDGKTVVAPQRHAMNAIALLHPVTDEVIDSGNFDPRTMKKLTELLAGKAVDSNSPYEKLVFDLVGNIQTAFPPEEHPLLDWSLRSMHALQMKSTQQKGDLPLDTILHTSFFKGGLATLIAGYLSIGKLSTEQQAFFFKSGCAFQLLDDLSDIEQDRKDGIGTVWTKPLREKRGVRDTLKRLLQMERAFEDEMKTWNDGSLGLEKMKAIYPFGFKATLVKALTKNTDPEVLKLNAVLRPYLPVSPATVGRFHRAANEMLEQTPQLCGGYLRLLMQANELY